MERIDNLLNTLATAATEKGLCKSRLAKQAGVHHNTLKLFPTPDWSPSIETIRRLERVLLPQQAANIT